GVRLRTAHFASYFLMRAPPISTLFPYTTLFRSRVVRESQRRGRSGEGRRALIVGAGDAGEMLLRELGRSSVLEYDILGFVDDERSEEHTSELQSRGHLVCRLLLEKKKHRPLPAP